MKNIYQKIGLSLFVSLGISAAEVMEVWKNGTLTAYQVNEVDSVTFKDNSGYEKRIANLTKLPPLENSALYLGAVKTAKWYWTSCLEEQSISECKANSKPYHDYYEYSYSQDGALLSYGNYYQDGTINKEVENIIYQWNANKIIRRITTKTTINRDSLGQEVSREENIDIFNYDWSNPQEVIVKDTLGQKLEVHYLTNSMRDSVYSYSPNGTLNTINYYVQFGLWGGMKKWVDSSKVYTSLHERQYQHNYNGLIVSGWATSWDCSTSQKIFDECNQEKLDFIFDEHDDYNNFGNWIFKSHNTDSEGVKTTSYNIYKLEYTYW